MNKDKKILPATISFGKDNLELLENWKKACLNKYGSGGITKRIQELIQKDLKTLEELN